MTDSARKISKRQLIALRGAKCEICGITEWCNKPITFDDHHCDRNRKNDIESNRKIICPNCHRQTYMKDRAEQAKKRMLGVPKSKEQKQKLSIANKGYKHSDEAKQKMSIENTGKKRSEETRQKMSIAHVGLHVGEKNGMYGKEPWNKGKKTSKEIAL